MTATVTSRAGLTALGREIVGLISAEGPIGVDRFMALALGHPTLGYYRTRDPLGAAGDFTTAPEVSQMFGELLGLWAGAVWVEMGRPSRVALVEFGPGRGTLMSDLLRAARIVPGFLAAISVHLVETGPVLRDRQRETLRTAPVPIAWHASADEIPPGPAIVLANEFLDALPIRPFVRGEAGWHERLVGLGSDGDLVFGLAPRPEVGLAAVAGRPGDVLEIGAAAREIVATLADRLVRQGGAALMIDYGSAEGRLGDTLQAVRRHRFADPLAAVGDCDLTAHVDFRALVHVASAAGAAVHGPIEQGAFLEALGIGARAERLAGGGSDAAAGARAAMARLTGTGPGGMGGLFKAFAISDPSLEALPGLPPVRRDEIRTAANRPESQVRSRAAC